MSQDDFFALTIKSKNPDFFTQWDTITSLYSENILQRKIDLLMRVIKVLENHHEVDQWEGCAVDPSSPWTNMYLILNRNSLLTHKASIEYTNKDMYQALCW